MHPHSHSSAVSGPHDRAGTPSPSGEAGRHWFRVTALKPVTYSVMHLVVAVSVAYALTQDWRIALGVGIIEPMVQTVAYVFHEKAWAVGTRPRT
jgi:uncharacterized membrane protein